MKTITKILPLLLMGALGNIPASVLAQDDKAEAKQPKLKVHLNTTIRDDLGMSADDVNKASRWFFSNHGIDMVDESAEGVIELQVVVGQNDDDVDNDGVADAEDTDDDGDKIADDKETEIAISMDKAEADVMKEFPNKDKGRGVYILFYTNGKKSEHIVGVSEVDSFEAKIEVAETDKKSASPDNHPFFSPTGIFPSTPAPALQPRLTPSLIPMAFPTAVNDQITDSITQANVKSLGEAPAMAMGALYMATAQALANAARNATTSQQQANITAQAATTMGVATLLSLDTAATGVATKDIFK